MTQVQMIKRAAAVLEGLALIWENGPKTAARADTIIGSVYRCSHIANCRCENHHADWLVEMNETYEAFIKSGLITRID
jgi:hypothetical protein